MLRLYGVVTPVAERQVRGAIEHFYASRVAENAIVEELLEETKEVDEAPKRDKPKG